MAEEVARTLRGWGAYFRYSQAHEAFGEVWHFAFDRLCQLYWRRRRRHRLRRSHEVTWARRLVDGVRPSVTPDGARMAL